MHTLEKTETEVLIELTIPWTDVEAPFNAKIQEASKHVDLKGFRKGKVPTDVAEKSVNRDAILSEVVDEALRTAYPKIVTEENLKIAGSPQVQVKKLAEGNDVIIGFTSALIPEAELPKDWKKIVKTVNKEKAGGDVVVDDAEVDAELTRLAEARTEEKDVARPAADGDMTKIDFVVKQEGVIIEGGTSTDHAIILGSGAFIPGFEEQVIGMTAGESKTFELAFPDKYHADHLAGKPATFEVTLKAVQERIVPAIDDTFAKSAGKDIDSLATLKKNLRDGMTEEKKRAQEEERKTAYLDALSDATELAVADGLIDDELNRMVGEMEQQTQQSGMPFDAYLEQMGKTRDDLKVSWKPQALKRIKSALLLEKLGEELDITPENDAVQAEMNKTIQMYGGEENVKDKIDLQQLYAYTQGMLRNESVFEQLGRM